MGPDEDEWQTNRMESVLRNDRRTRDLASLGLSPVVFGIVYAVWTWRLGQTVLSLLVAGLFAAMVFVGIQLPRRYAEKRNATHVSFGKEALGIRTLARGEWSVPWERIHTVWRKRPSVDFVYYFNADGWLRGFSVDKDLGATIDARFTQLQMERGPLPRPPVAFRPVVTVPWLVAGPVAMALGLPTYLAGLEGADRWLQTWGLSGLMGGFGMLLYGLFTLVWFVRERKRRARGEASALLIAGLE